jgi:hypothetical protein
MSDLWQNIIIETVFFVLAVAVAVSIAEYVDWRQERSKKRKDYDDWMNRGGK